MKLGLSLEELFLLAAALAIIAIMVSMVNMDLVVMSVQAPTGKKLPGTEKGDIPWLEIAAVRVKERPNYSRVIDISSKGRDVSRPKSDLPVGIERLARTQ